MFTAVYNLIESFGLLVIKTVTGTFAFLKKYISKFLKWFFKRFKEYNRQSFSSFKKFSLRTIAFILVFTAVFSVFAISQNRSTKTKAFEVILNGETVGFINDSIAAQTLEKDIIKKLNSKKSIDLKIKDTKTEPINIIPSDVLTDTLINKIAPDYIKVCEVYIDGELICAVKDQLTAYNAINDCLEVYKTKYPKSSVSFSQEISFKYAYYKSSDENIWTEERLELAIKTFELLTIQHVECETKISTVKYETVDIETNTLFIGDSRIRRAGKNGSEYVINLVTYIDNKRVLSQNLTSLSINAPVSQVIERGMRAESISMGSYTVTQTTGYFVWPVVNLDVVTSPFGHRSLGYHRGIDISGANASGSLIVAGASGVVTEAGWSTGGYGNYVKIDHGNGIETLYAHMLNDSIMVSVGDQLTKGQAIGRVGNTGYSFGAHLHFEVRINGTRVNPAPYLGL